MLRRKSLSIVVISSLLVFIFMFIYLKKSIDTDYKNLEIMRSKSVYYLVDNEFQGIYKDLEKINGDWSSWDNTYRFIEGNDKEKEEFIKSNLPDRILSDLSLDFIIFVDDFGKILYQKGYDDLNKNKISLKKIELITKQISDYKDKTGMLVDDDKQVYIFSNLKITDTKEIKRQKGNLIMGYFLNKNRVMTMEKKLGVQLNVAGISKKIEIPYKINIGKNKIYNKLYISTLSGESVIFDNQRDADILILGKKNIKKYIVILFINFIILVSAIYIFMEFIIVKRLRKMDCLVRDIIKCQDLRKRIKIKGKDEISNLGKNINNLLEDLHIRKEKLYSLAAHDVMTGILNRHAGLEKLEKIFEQTKGKKEVLTIVFIDINDLKYVNDKYSHEEGDQLIKNIVEIIKKKLKPQDVFLRFGGDEFILGFTRLNLLEVHLLFNEIEENMEKYNNESLKEYKYSISVGIEECSEDKTLDEFVNIADMNMYENKKYKKKFPERKYVR